MHQEVYLQKNATPHHTSSALTLMRIYIARGSDTTLLTHSSTHALHLYCTRTTLHKYGTTTHLYECQPASPTSYTQAHIPNLPGYSSGQQPARPTSTFSLPHVSKSLHVCGLRLVSQSAVWGGLARVKVEMLLDKSRVARAPNIGQEKHGS